MSYYGRHQNLLKKAIMHVQKHFNNIRLFPAQVGKFYVKRGFEFDGPYKIGTPGQADLNGFISLPLSKLNEIFSQQQIIAVRVEVEVKSGKVKIKKNSDQDRWKNICQKFGVIHIVATNESSITDELKRIFKDEQISKSL